MKELFLLLFQKLFLTELLLLFLLQDLYYPDAAILNILSNDTLHPVENVPHLHLSIEFHRTFCFVLLSAISTAQAFPVLEYNAFCPVRFFRICPACSLPVAVPDRPDCIWTQPMFCMYKHQTDLIPLLLLS